MNWRSAGGRIQLSHDTRIVAARYQLLYPPCEHEYALALADGRYLCGRLFWSSGSLRVCHRQEAPQDAPPAWWQAGRPVAVMDRDDGSGGQVTEGPIPYLTYVVAAPALG